MELAGRVAIVTGAGQGIGRAIALELARLGADVGVADLNSATVESVAEEVRVLGRRGIARTVDVSKKQQVEELVGGINDELGGQPLAVFINSPSRYGVAFDPVVEGQQLTFVLEDGAFFDVETWSRWDLNGLAVDGPLAGVQLVILPSRTAFWFSILSAYPAVTVAGVDTSLEAAGA